MHLNFLVFLILALIFVEKIASQSVKCAYWHNKDEIYNCDLTFENDGDVSSISGDHKIGQSNGDVQKITSNNKNTLVKIWPTIVCEKFPNLTNLLMNQLKADENSLKQCKNIESLTMTYAVKEGDELQENLFVENTNLKSVLISFNEMGKLPGRNLFAKQKNLESLSLNADKLVELPVGIFDPLHNLKYLSLGVNKLTSMPAKIFENLAQLESLALDKNKFSALNPKWFESVTKLKTLYLEGNIIEQLAPNVFAALTNLEELSLNENQLSIINSNSFGKHVHFTTFYFHINNIEKIDKKLIDNTSLKAIKAYHNPCVESTNVITDETESRSLIKAALKKCFDNYDGETESSGGIIKYFSNLFG